MLYCDWELYEEAWNDIEYNILNNGKKLYR